MNREIGEMVGVNKSTVQDIKAKIDNYDSPLSHKHTSRPLKINERTERELKRITGEDPFVSYKKINMELAKPDAFVCIETLRSYVAQLDFKSYRAAHNPRLTARHCKSRLCWAKEHINWTKD
jgi:transposase